MLCRADMDFSWRHVMFLAFADALHKTPCLCSSECLLTRVYDPPPSITEMSTDPSSDDGRLVTRNPQSILLLQKKIENGMLMQIYLATAFVLASVN